MFSNIAQIVTMDFCNFCMKMCYRELSKTAQSGHTGPQFRLSALTGSLQTWKAFSLSLLFFLSICASANHPYLPQSRLFFPIFYFSTVPSYHSSRLSMSYFFLSLCCIPMQVNVPIQVIVSRYLSMLMYLSKLSLDR